MPISQELQIAVNSIIQEITSYNDQLKYSFEEEAVFVKMRDSSSIFPKYQDSIARLEKIFQNPSLNQEEKDFIKPNIDSYNNQFTQFRLFTRGFIPEMNRLFLNLTHVIKENFYLSEGPQVSDILDQTRKILRSDYEPQETDKVLLHQIYCAAGDFHLSFLKRFDEANERLKIKELTPDEVNALYKTINAEKYEAKNYNYIQELASVKLDKILSRQTNADQELPRSFYNTSLEQDNLDTDKEMGGLLQVSQAIDRFEKSEDYNFNPIEPAASLQRRGPVVRVFPLTTKSLEKQ